MKIIVTSHGGLCQGILESYEMVAGKNPSLLAVKLDDDGISKFAGVLRKTTEQILTEEEVLILCDIKGGTPYNESYSLFLEYPERIRVVTGVNLPMVIEAGFCLAGETDLERLAEMAF